MEHRPELVVCRGLSASGKTTWARAWVDEDPVRRARVCRDDLRQMVYGAGPDVESYQAYFVTENLHVREAAVTAASHEAVRGLLENGRSVVVDDTNLRVRYLRQWAEVAGDCGAEFHVQDFTDVPVEECVRRDLVRGLRVGRTVIEDMHRRYLLGVTGLGLDEHGAGWRYEPDDSRPDAWIVDMDGTLALHDGRSPYDLTRVSEDLVNEPVRDLVRHLMAPTSPHDVDCAAILVVSGREDTPQCRADTTAWLDKHGVVWSRIFMRAEGDRRDDALVKMEILRDQIAPLYHVLGAVDDRNRVVRMWRRVGLLCLQVAPGAF